MEIEIEIQDIGHSHYMNDLSKLITTVVNSNDYLFANTQLRLYFLFTDLIEGVEASFLPLRSSQSEFYFLFNNDLKPGGDDFNSFAKILTHELGHAADLAILKENHFIYRDSLNLNNRFSFDEIKIDVAKSVDSYSLQWCLLNYIATIRNEGVALLNEVIHGYRRLPDLENARKEFIKSVDFVVDFSRNIHYYNRFNRDQTINLFRGMEQNIYSFADAVLLSVLTADHQQVNNGDEGFSDQELKSILLKALEFDVSEWIDAVLFGEYLNELEKQEVQLFNMLSSFGDIAFDKDPQIGKKLMAIATNREKQRFLDIVNTYIDKQRSYLELRTDLVELNRLDLRSDIRLANRKLALELFEKLNTHNSQPILIAALNYYLSSNDLISDDVPFMGEQDDWFVLEGARNLLF